MEVMFFIGLAALILFGPWIYIGVVHHRLNRYKRENEEHWNHLETRLGNLEGVLNELRKTVERPERVQSPAPAAQPAAAPEASPKPAAVTPSPTLPEKPPAPLPTASVGPTPREQVLVAKTEAAAPMTPPSPPAPPTFATLDAIAAKTPPQAGKQRIGLEEQVGANWLNKLGIVILVLGVAFFLAYQLQTLGPLGKVLVGFAVSGALLGAGVFFEKNERYRVLARAGIGGGWALLFFTTYAMYHVGASHVLDSQALDLVLMLAVAAAMVWHTLRYDSQVVTGLAFLLAFTTVTISRVSVYSLSAGVILALGLVTIALHRGWFELEIFGILASYINHYFWLRPIIEPMAGKRHPFPEFTASAAILILYWLIFRVSYIIRRTDRREIDESVSTVAALLNGGLLLWLMKYQSVHPEWAFRFLLALGAVELVLGQLPITRRRRIAFIVLATIGATLMVSAIPFKYSGTSLSVLWIMESEALFLAGFWTNEVVFRRLGMLATVPLAIQMVILDAQRASVGPDFKLGVVFFFASLVFYANADGFARRRPELFQHNFDRLFLEALSWVAAVMALLGSWVALHDAWVGVAWGAIGLLLTVVANRLKIASLSAQANLLALAAVARVLLVNVEMAGTFHQISLRLITVSCIIVLLYLSAPWTSLTEIQQSARIPSAYTWVGSFLVGLLMWYELRPISVALGWALFGLVLLELGMALQRVSLRLQAYTALAASFVRLFFVNLNAKGAPGELSPRLYTILPLALAYFYVYLRLESSQDAFLGRDRWLKAAAVHCYFGVIALVALVRFEMDPDWVIGIWAGMVFIFTVIAWQTERAIFLDQGMLLSVAVLFRTIFHNFYQGTYFASAGWNSRMVCVSAAALFLVLAVPIGFQLRRAAQPGDSQSRLRRAMSAPLRHPEQMLFFIPLVMVTVLLALEMRSGMITVAWGVEGVLVFLLALWVSERSYRLSGLGLLLLCVGKIVVVDVWRLGQRDRYLTFIVLGSALLLVSFLYSRYREAVRQYL